jgi:chromatin remodeling complex protein RSC6
MAAKAKKVAFGGYSINFKGCSDTLESIMGSSPITPPEMTKKIWGYVKKRKLGGKKK